MSQLLPLHQAGPALAMAPAPAEPTLLSLESPIDLRQLQPLAAASAGEVAAAVARARLAQGPWRWRPLSERTQLLKGAAKEMLRRRDEAIALTRSEMGKVNIEGLFNEGLGPLEMVAGFAAVAEQGLRPRKVRLNPLSFPGKRALVEQIPRGVVGVIAPWNFPVAGLYRSIFPALLTGNAVVLKPSEYTPRSSAWLAQRLAEALPADLVQVVQGGATTGSALIDAGIDACVFTGSVASGTKVRLRCAERAIPSSIEMGGKDAALVLADCDLPRTVAGITHWALSNAGQACGAVEVAYVDEAIADALVARLRSAWVRLRASDSPFAEVGPLANRRQLALVEAHVADARAKGAEVLCGGRATGEGLWFEPTLLDRCQPEMAVVTDETFGPLLAVVRVSGAEEAIRAINRGRYGLTASIWSQDIARAERLAERLEVGVVTINNHALTGAIPSLPWTGTRDTGFGVASGLEGLATFVRPKTLLVDESKSPQPFWMPYDRTLAKLGEVLADAQLGKLTQAWRLPLLMRQRLRTVRRFFE